MHRATVRRALPCRIPFTLHITPWARRGALQPFDAQENENSHKQQVQGHPACDMAGPRFVASCSDYRAPDLRQQQPMPLGEEGSMRATGWPCWRTGGGQGTSGEHRWSRRRIRPLGSRQKSGEDRALAREDQQCGTCHREEREGWRQRPKPLMI